MKKIKNSSGFACHHSNTNCHSNYHQFYKYLKMKKQITYIVLLGSALLAIPFVMDFPDDYSIAKAEAESVTTIHAEASKIYDNKGYMPAYEVGLDVDSIYIFNEYGKAIHAESYDSGSELAKAILKDNE